MARYSSANGTGIGGGGGGRYVNGGGSGSRSGRGLGDSGPYNAHASAVGGGAGGGTSHCDGSRYGTGSASGSGSSTYSQGTAIDLVFTVGFVTTGFLKNGSDSPSWHIIARFWLKPAVIGPIDSNIRTSLSILDKN